VGGWGVGEKSDIRNENVYDCFCFLDNDVEGLMILSEQIFVWLSSGFGPRLGGRVLMIKPQG
jgi:hypothetical protein